MLEVTRAPRRATPCAFPLDWKAGDAEREIAHAVGLTAAQVEASEKRFKAHWRARPSKRKANWTASWANWVKGDAERVDAKAAVKAALVDEDGKPIGPPHCPRNDDPKFKWSRDPIAGWMKHKRDTPEEEARWKRLLAEEEERKRRAREDRKIEPVNPTPQKEWAEGDEIPF